MNCTLARTIIPLSGQLEWAVSITNGAPASLDIRPVSEHIDFVNTRNSLLYEHQYNIKHLYESIHDSFYTSVLKPELRSWGPVRTDVQKDTHEDSYEYGVSRVSHKKTGKAFKMLVPIWLDDLEDVPEIRINLSMVSPNNLRNSNSNTNAYDGTIKDGFIVDSVTNIMRWTLVLSRYDDSDTVQGKIARYFWNYIDYVFKKTEFGQSTYDNFLYLSFVKEKANIAGVDCASGTPIVKSVNNIISTLTDRERPVMEQNHMMTSLWMNNDMICNQLFNFAFYFNVHDLGIFTSDMDFSNFNMIATVDVGHMTVDDDTKTIKFDELKLKDFLFNYTYIQQPKYFIDVNAVNNMYVTNSDAQAQINAKAVVIPVISDEVLNVYDYLKDDKFIDFAKKNKLVPNDIFMALADYDKIPFTLYDGFSPVVEYSGKDDKTSKDNSTTVKCSANMGLTANVYAREFTPTNNTIIWINWVCGHKSKIDALIKNTYASTVFINNGGITTWNGVKYDTTAWSSDTGTLSICGFVYKDSEFSTWMFNGNSDAKEIYLSPYKVKFENGIYSIYAWGGPEASASDNTALDFFGNAQNIKDVLINTLTYKCFSDFITGIKNKTELPAIKITKDGLAGNTISNIELVSMPYDRVTNKDTKDIDAEIYNTKDGNLEPLASLFDCIMKPSIIFFNRSIAPVHAPSWDSNTDNVTFNKVDDFYKYIIRYDGKMKPMFIDGSSQYYNCIYQFKKIPKKGFESNIPKYIELSQTNFTPIYKGTDYYPLEEVKLTFTDTEYFNGTTKYKETHTSDAYYTKYPRIMHFTENSNDSQKRYEENFFEMKWYKDSNMIVLPEIIDNIEVDEQIDEEKDNWVTNIENNANGIVMNLVSVSGNKTKVYNVPSIDDVRDYVVKKLCDKYIFGDVTDKEKIAECLFDNFIKDMYDMSYVIVNKGDKNVFNIKYTLK